MSSKPPAMKKDDKQAAGPAMGPMGRNPMAMMQPPQKAKNFKGTMKQLFTYLKPFWGRITFVLFCTIASTVFAILSPKILGQITNEIVDGTTNRVAYTQIVSKLPADVVIQPGMTGSKILENLSSTVLESLPPKARDVIKNLDLSKRPEFNYSKMRMIAIQLVALFAISALFNYIQGLIMTNISQKITYQFRRDISTKIRRIPLKFFDGTTHGEVLSRVTNDVDTVGTTLNQSLTQILTSVTTIIGIMIVMLTISWQMTLVALATLPISFGLMMFLVKRSQKFFKEQQATLGHLNGHIEEMFGGHTVMKVFNGQYRSIATFTKHNTTLFGSAWKSQFLSGLMFPLMTFVGNLGYVGVAVVGGWLALHGRISIGDIQAFIQYVGQFNQPVMQTANVANVLQSTAAAAERVFEFLAEEEASAEPVGTHALSNVTGAIAFDHVSFGYKPDQTIIHDVSVKIEPGQKVAIVGPTGAGKTTIVNLLMRFYDVRDGSITIDGVDTKTMSRNDVRALFGMVLQDTWLFNGTIRENIAYGKPDASEEEIVAAAKAAHVDHFVHGLPKGYDMVLDEEANNISQGEKQLLTIARAMLVKTPMLILDEATSSVDTRTEVLIQQAMNRLLEGKTSFVIAHRLSTIKNADLILVMKDGNIVEHGKHEALLGQKGFYASLYNSQFTGAV